MEGLLLNGGVLMHPAHASVTVRCQFATHLGHVISVYVYATREDYALHWLLIENDVHSTAPNRGKYRHQRR